MSAALTLYRLQQTDSRMDQIRARLKTIQETLENDVTLRAATREVNSAEKIHKEASLALKQAEAEVEKQNTKIQQTEASLYSGTVKNPKELQDLQMDVASLKKHLETLEERELDAMAEMEKTEQVLANAKDKLQNIQADLKDQNRDLANESGTLNKDLETLESERNAVLKDIDQNSVQIYEQLRGQKRGVAVSSLSDNACSACGTTLTASQQQIARTSTGFFHCPTCGRIMYAG